MIQFISQYCVFQFKLEPASNIITALSILWQTDICYSYKNIVRAESHYSAEIYLQLARALQNELILLGKGIGRDCGYVALMGSNGSEHLDLHASVYA